MADFAVRAPAAVASRPSRLAAAGSPPWLWVWVAVVYLPTARARWSATDRHWDELLGAGPEFETVSHLDGYWVVRLLAATTIFSAAMVAAGLVAFCLPWLRRLYVERRYGLTAAAPASPAVEEIRAHLAASGVRAEVRANLARTDLTALVYPRGFRRPALAVFGGLVRLWRTDRAAAAAVIDHEVAHLRAGDHLVSGVGSLFAIAVRVSVPVLLAANLVALFAEDHGLSGSTGLLSVLESVYPLLLPVIALWLLELDADRAVAMAGGRAALARALAPGTRRPVWWRRALHALSHPPHALRRRLVERWGSARLQVALLAVFPVAYLLQVVVVSAVATRSAMAGGYSFAEAWDLVRPHAVALAERMAPKAAGMVVLVLGWAWLATGWRRLWRGRAAALA